MKKILISLLCGIAFITPAVLASSISFPDVPSSQWFYQDVVNMVEWGVITGNSDGTFAPERSVNRAELSAMWNRYNDYLKTQFVSKSGTNDTPTPPVSSNGDSLEILSHSLKKGSMFWEVNGEVRNGLGESVEMVSLSLTLYDINNTVIGTETAYVAADTLEPGQKSPFKFLFQPVEGYDHYEVQLIQ